MRHAFIYVFKVPYHTLKNAGLF